MKVFITIKSGKIRIQNQYTFKAIKLEIKFYFEK